MLENPSFDSSGIKTLCEMNGKNADMLMNIYVRHIKKGESFSVNDDKNETAVLLTQGYITFEWEGKKEEGKRADPFEKKPYALHVCKNTPVKITALDDSEVIVQQTNNEKTFDPQFYNPENCLYQEFGKDQWNGAGHRVVSTMFDPDNAPYSNMVLGEVFNKPGCWSSYPPHYHPQPEVYYYRFDKPSGFGACFNGDDVYKSTDTSFCTIRNGQCHQQVVGPGYTMYYVWMIRHLDGDPWYKTTRIVPPEHQWMLKDDWSKK